MRVERKLHTLCLPIGGSSTRPYVLAVLIVCTVRALVAVGYPGSTSEETDSSASIDSPDTSCFAVLPSDPADSTL